MESITHTYTGTKMPDIHANTFAKHGIPISLHAQNEDLLLFFESENDRRIYINKLERIKFDLSACDLDKKKIKIQDTIAFINIVVALLSIV